MTRALALVCTLSPSPKPSSSQLLADQIMAELSDLNVRGRQCGSRTTTYGPGSPRTWATGTSGPGSARR